MAEASPPRGPWLIPLIVACAMFMAQLDTTVVSTALPQLAESFGVAPINLSIGITVYILAQAALLPASSWLADRFGGRTVFALSIAGFTVSSALCGLCETLPQFIAARAVQGLTAALMTPVGRLVLLQSTDRSDLIRVMNISTIPMLVAPTIGPALGGFITTYLSWHWIFFLNLPIGIVGVILVLRFVPPLKASERRPFDGLGFSLMAGGVSALLYGLDRMGNGAAGGWAVPVVLTVLGLGLLALAFLHAQRAKYPLISIPALKIPSYTMATIGAGALIRVPVRALPFVFVLMLQVVHGMSAFRAGLLLLAVNAGDLLLKTVTSPALRRYGFRTTLIASGYLTVLPIMACAALVPGTPDWAIFIVLAISGAGRSFLFTGMSSLAFADIPSQETGGASVLWYLSQQVTMALGISLAAVFMNLTGWATGGPAGVPTLLGCQVALLAMGAIGLGSVVMFRGIARDAGADISGHRPKAQS